jgi:hypothetical protein
MQASTARRTALVLWMAFAFVIWNVIFDRHVYVAAVRFTQQQIERHERGEQVSSIEEAFTPEVGRAALRASLWGGTVLAIGIVLTGAAARRTRSS